EIPVPVQPS
nr:Chain F, Heat shock protein beta-6 [Homo sapiens]5LUM_G Chain G, Heat shock protein beta-6 [Homo sapiens]5LUM_H Chain H, Heat shock protein beta-6 [Homo sapiens]5LUM_I Chain I, Heat shock protein beta-6 [Homo sapiens]5LUM_J Chain J, Heat shock protein beta-6 [Homo sapiens]